MGSPARRHARALSNWDYFRTYCFSFRFDFERLSNSYTGRESNRVLAQTQKSSMPLRPITSRQSKLQNEELTGMDRDKQDESRSILFFLSYLSRSILFESAFH